jgi:hypothetical protein
MKIIAKTKDGYILESTSKEVANFVGYYSEYDAKFKDLKLNIGDEIHVSDVYRKLNAITRHRRELESISRALRGILEFVEPICPVLFAIEDELNNEGGVSND